MSFHLEQQYPDQRADSIERDQSGKSNIVLTGTACLLSLLAIVIAAFSIYLVFILQWQGPFRDLWEFVDDIERQFRGEWSSVYLLEAYGGAHRIFLPKLIFFADYYWFTGRNLLTIATALLCQFCYLFIIFRALKWQFALTNAERLIIASAFALALFSTTQVLNFLYAMDVQWYMSNLFGLASLYALTNVQERPALWISVIFFGITASLCNFTGLMPLPVAALAILLHKRHSKGAWFLLPVIALLSFLYVNHDKNNQQFILVALKNSDSISTSLYIVMDTLQKMAPYLLRYLASPLSRNWPVVGNALSTIGIAMTLYYWWRLFRQPDSVSRWQKLCLYVSTCIIASGFFTAFGRIIYPNSSVAERYQTLVLPWLPALFGMAWMDVRNCAYRHGILAGWLILFGCYLLPSQPSSARDMVILGIRVNLAHTAARAGVLEPPYINATLSYPLIKQGINSVKENDNFLRGKQLGYFQHLPEYTLDKKISGNSTLPACTGYAKLEYKDDIRAWIANGQLLADKKAASDIVFLQNESVIGLGTLVGSDDSLLPAIWQPAETSRFRGFMPGNKYLPEHPLVALGVIGDKAACRFTVSR